MCTTNELAQIDESIKRGNNWGENDGIETERVNEKRVNYMHSKHKTRKNDMEMKKKKRVSGVENGSGHRRYESCA